MMIMMTSVLFLQVLILHSFLLESVVANNGRGYDSPHPFLDRLLANNAVMILSDSVIRSNDIPFIHPVNNNPFLRHHDWTPVISTQRNQPLLSPLLGRGESTDTMISDLRSIRDNGYDLVEKFKTIIPRLNTVNKVLDEIEETRNLAQTLKYGLRPVMDILPVIEQTMRVRFNHKSLNSCDAIILTL
jgi:hypothetical protein